jgi:capsular exopolysaccharide synthesis family protein
MDPMEATSDNYYLSPPPGRSVPPGGFDLRRPLRVVCLRLGWIPPILSAFIILGIAAAVLWPPSYEARTILKSSPKTSNNDQILNAQQISVPYPGSEDPEGNFLAIALSDNVVQRVQTMLAPGQSNPDFKGLTTDEQVRRKLHGMITVGIISGSDLFSFTARARTAQFAADLANTWAHAYMLENLDLSHKSAEAKNQFLKEQADEYEKRIKNPNRLLNAQSKSDDNVYRMLVDQIEQTNITANVDDAGMIVMTPAVPPAKPTDPKRRVIFMGFFFLGLILSIGSTFLNDFLEGKVNCQVPMEKMSGLPNYPFIPDFRDELERKPTDFQAPPEKNSLISNPRLNGSRYSESFKVLGASLSSVRTEYPLRTLGFFSARNREGKTLVGANLAISIAQSGRKLLLVDADFKNPSIASLFGVSAEAGGLPGLLEGGELSALTVESGIPNLWLLPTPLSASDRTAPLASAALVKAIEEMKKEYDLVIFDTAPLLPSADPLILSTLLDGVILLSRWNATRSQEFSKAFKYLKSVETPLLGTLLNGVQMNKGLPGWAAPHLGKWLWED